MFRNFWNILVVLGLDKRLEICWWFAVIFEEMFSELDRERGEGGGEVMVGSVLLFFGVFRGVKWYKYKI